MEPEPENTCEVVILEDWLLNTLLKGADDQFYIEVSGGRDAGKIIPLSSFSEKFEEYSFGMCYSPVKKDVAVDVICFSWWRKGARLFFSVPGLYQALGFNQYNGESWRWYFSGRKAWIQRLEQHGLQEHLVHSTQIKVKPGVEEDSPKNTKQDRCHTLRSRSGL